MLCVILITPLVYVNSGQLFPSANGQRTVCNDLESTNELPVLLIHSWNEGSARWDQWVELLDRGDIPSCTFSFQYSNDACGRAIDHANELGQIIQNTKGSSGQNQVNIVGYSKGGLDARVYLDRNPSSDDVANLIMIGTLNAGSPFALSTNRCWPAIEDLRRGSPATEAEENIHTKYHTIAGTCLPYYAIGLLVIISEPNDGLVGVTSINSQPYFHSLGYSPNCHLYLLGSYRSKY